MNRTNRLLLCGLLSFWFGIASFPPSIGVAGNEEQSQQVYTLDELRTRETTTALLDRADEMIGTRKGKLKRAKKEDDDDLEDDLEDELEILEYARSELKAASKSSASERIVFETNSYADRILQTVEKPIEAEFLPNPGGILKNLVLGSLMGQGAPRQPKAIDQPIGRKAAERESAYLHHPENADFYTFEELAALSPVEIAALDISPDNPNWYDRESFRNLGPDPVAHFERFMARGMTNALREDDDLKPGETYDPQQTRKVLFLEEIYHSATSPKSHVEDAYGVEWKLKWGDEVAVEPVSGSLYLLAGAKMTDLTFTNGFGPDDMILILLDPEDAEEEREDADEAEKQFPTTVDELVASVMDLYKFPLEPYLHSHGTITEANIDRLLRNLPANGKKKYRKEKLIGRKWVAFRESSVELDTKGFVRRHDGSRVSDYVAVHDRASRGTYMFDIWISNRDAKSGNNKAYLIKEPAGKDMEIAEYREGHHDLGLSLGSMWSAGAANKLGVGNDFLRKGLFGRPRFQQTAIFRPAAWDAATWSDCRWISEHLAGISESRLRGAVARSGWPDFVQETMTYKLLRRRDQIASLFGVSTETSRSGPTPPSIAISLRDSAEIRTAERRYGLEPGSLAVELQQSGIGPGHVESVVVNGDLVACEKSALIRLLTRQRYPSGLSSRYRRSGDREADCLRPE